MSDQPASHVSAQGLSHHMLVLLVTLHCTFDSLWEPRLQQPMCSTLINMLVQIGNGVNHGTCSENTRVDNFDLMSMVVFANSSFPESCEPYY